MRQAISKSLNIAASDMTDPGYERELGGVQARLEELERGQDQIKRDVREIRDVVVSVKGGWKTIAVIASLSAAIGALVTKIAAWLMMLPR